MNIFLEDRKDMCLQAFDELAECADKFGARVYGLAQELETDCVDAIEFLEINYELKDIADYLARMTKFGR